MRVPFCLSPLLADIAPKINLYLLGKVSWPDNSGGDKKAKKELIIVVTEEVNWQSQLKEMTFNDRVLIYIIDYGYIT